MDALPVFLAALVMVLPGVIAQEDAGIMRVSEIDLSEGVVLLDLMATWCPDCRKEMEQLRKVNDAYGSEIMIISVDIDTRESAELLAGYRDEIGAEWIFALDDAGLNAEYRVTYIPTLVLLKDGEQVKRYVGNPSADTLMRDIGMVL